jgi:hypothetical protein
MGSLQFKQTANEKPDLLHQFSHYAPMIGSALVIGGILLFIDQKINTGWIPVSLPIVVGLVILSYAFINKVRGWLIAGFAFTSVAGALFLVFQPFIKLETNQLISAGLGFFGLSWLGMFISIGLINKKFQWWNLFLISMSLAISVVFYLGELLLLNFILAVTLAIGFSFITWGIARRNIGLIIPGLLIPTIGIGVFNGWKTVSDLNGLRDTGIMLVWFSLGWILITVCSRIFKKRFIWWPLIPGGILAMVGSGLYIGGNPSNATGFIQNTGSIGLVLLGVYLILLKFGLKK